MFENLKICFSAQVVIVLGILNTCLDIFYFGFNFFIFLFDVFITAMLYLLTNWLCVNNWNSLSWVLPIILALITFMGIYLYRTKDPIFLSELEKQKEVVQLKKKDEKK